MIIPMSFEDISQCEYNWIAVDSEGYTFVCVIKPELNRNIWFAGDFNFQTRNYYERFHP